MACRVTISPQALADAESVLAYLAEIDTEFAVSWINGLEDTIESLSEFPQRCGLAFESHAFGLDVRQVIYGDGPNAYRVLFTIQGDEVRVHHVRHCRRKPLGSREFP